jgi:organic hydroperoxide reductase OsmC/OhrA
MRIIAQVRSTRASHQASCSTSGHTKVLALPAKVGAPGSEVNGGELLMLAVATCFCNDIYREAARLNVQVDAVEVEAEADFEGIGQAASQIRYCARIASPASPSELAALLEQTDAVAEIHNTIRKGVPVMRVPWESAD